MHRQKRNTPQHINQKPQQGGCHFFPDEIRATVAIGLNGSHQKPVAWKLHNKPLPLQVRNDQQLAASDDTISNTHRPFFHFTNSFLR